MLKSVTIRATLLAFTSSLSIAAYAVADPARQVDIPAGDLSEALIQLASRYGVDLFYRPEQVRGLATHGAHGELTTEQAVARLLEGTSLELSTDATGAMVIALPTPAAPRAASPDATAPDAAVPDAAGADRTAPATNAASEANSASLVEEIVVTAQKRMERLQDVPVPVTALRADSLANSNQLRLQDYYTRIPGVSMAADGFRGSSGGLIIRGLNTGGGNPTVGVVVDDVPYGSSTARGGGGVVADLDPSELTRIEVLRGPQGTLYGVSSIGGLLKYVTLDPSTEAFSGHVQAGVSRVHNGDDAGYNVRGAVNVPLGETLAIRASAFTRTDPGYVDDPGFGADAVNEVDVDGGRVSALWRPAEDLSLKLSALLQNSERRGLARVDLQSGLGDLQQINQIPNAGLYDGKSQVYSATFNAKLGSVSFTSLSGYNVSEFTDAIDVTSIYGPFTRAEFGGPATLLRDRNKTTKFTQEVRLSVPFGARFEWLVGAFYTDEDSLYENDIRPADAATGAPLAQGAFNTNPSTFSEYAVFTNLTWTVSDRLDVQIGGRQSENRQTNVNVLTGPLVPRLFGRPSPLVDPKLETRDESFTYLVTPRFKVSEDLMVYLRLASGYRAGGPNFLAAVFGRPPAFEPDKTQNYEIGTKGNLFAGAVVFDASLYTIEWKDIQLGVFDPSRGGSFQTNGSRARSRGAELSLESKPLTGLTVATSLSWTDAQLTEDFPSISSAVGRSGERLPLSSRFTGSFSLDQGFPIAGSVTGFAGASVTYVGDRKGSFASAFILPTPPRQELPSYTQTDLRAGVRYESWTANLFINNVTDRRGVLGPDQFFPTSAVYYIQPRTAGVSFGKTF